MTVLFFLVNAGFAVYWIGEGSPGYSALSSFVAGMLFALAVIEYPGE